MLSGTSLAYWALALALLQPSLSSPITTSGELVGADSRCGVDSTICVDKVNECGMKYGGCYVEKKCGGSGFTFKKPKCPKTSTSQTSSTTPAPTSTTKCAPNAGTILCVTYINECGIRYGDCAPINCDGSFPKPPAPPCPTTTSTTTSCAPNAGATVCVDSVNECGKKYGGCGPVNCDGSFPTFSKPPCPTTTACAPNAGATVCVDSVNECGKKYGGCGPVSCDGSFPTFSKPPCPSTTKITTTTTPPPTSTSCVPTAGATICVDYANECGIWYGGCGTISCDGSPPTYSKPPCPSTTTTTTKPSSNPSASTTTSKTLATRDETTTTPAEPTKTTPTTDQPTKVCAPNAGNIVCVTYLNDCGLKYATCGPVNCDGSFPKPEAPPCPSGADS